MDDVGKSMPVVNSQVPDGYAVIESNGDIVGAWVSYESAQIVAKRGGFIRPFRWLVDD